MSADNNSTSVFSQLSEAASEWTLLQLILCIFLTVVCVTTIIGNGVVLYVFKKSKRALRSPTHLIVANLAFADLLVGALVMPFLITVTVFDLKWYWGKFACRFGDYVHFCLCAVSMLSMTTVCLERLVGVKYPMHHKRILNRRRVYRIIVFLWFLAIVLTAIPLTVWPMNVPNPLYCETNQRSDFIFFISISLYWIPIAITTYIYWLIYKTSTMPSAELMKWARQSMGSTVITSTSLVNSTRRASKNPRRASSEEEKFEHARRKQMRLVKKTTIIVAGMLILYGPLFLLFLLKALKILWFNTYVLLTLGWLRYFSSTTNTFLYVIAVPYYKKELLRLLWNEKGSLQKSDVASSTFRHGKESSSYFDSSIPSTESEEIVKTTSSYDPGATPTATKGKRRFCESCGNALNLQSCCEMCDGEIPVGILKPSEIRGNSEELKCPGCMTNISFRDGFHPEFCKICNHKFQSRKKSSRKASEVNFNLVNEEDNSANVQIFPKRSLRNQSMAEAIESAAIAKLKLLETEDTTVVIQDLRKSLIMPLKDRKSQILTSEQNFSADIDWEAIQELDEIMAKIESDIIGPLIN